MIGKRLCIVVDHVKYFLGADIFETPPIAKYNICEAIFSVTSSSESVLL